MEKPEGQSNLSEVPHSTLRSIDRRAVIVLAVTVLYLAAFPFLHRAIGNTAGIFSTLPVVAAAWYFGARVGLLAGLATYPVHLPLVVLLAGQDWRDWAVNGGLIGSGATVLVGYVIGRLRDLRVAAQMDLLERTGVEEALRESESRLRALLDRYFDGISVVVDGKVAYANPTLCEMFGHESQDQILGRSPGDFVVPGERSRTKTRIADLEAGAPEYSSEYVGVKRNGVTFLVEVCSRSIPYEGRPALLSAIRDISQRKQAEQERDRTEAKNRALLDAIPDALFQISGEGVYLDFVPAKGFDLFVPPEAFVGKRIDEVMPREVADPTLQGVRQALQTRTAQEFEYDLVRRGKKRSYEARLVAAGDDQVLAIVRDITDRRQLKEQLLQSQKTESIGQLAGGIAHDFNNHLTIMIGESEILLTDLDQASPQHRGVKSILAAAGRAAALTRQLLAFGRKQMLDLTVLDLNSIVTNMQPLLRSLIGETCGLVTVLDPDLERVKADRGQMEQVLMNLAVNARDAMPEGGTIKISTANINPDGVSRYQHPLPAGRYIRLTVSDTGCGMDAETRSRAFDPFFTTKPPGKGSGLGLSTVYGIIKQTGGDISLSSEPRQGTTFQIYLPRVEEIADPAPPVIAVNLPTRGSETILLVEDEPDVRRLLQGILEGQGYTVLSARDGVEALRISGQHPGSVDLLVTDVVMPHMSGADLAERLVSQDPSLKVLYLSGYADEGIVHHGVLEQGKVLLRKPFTQADVARKVREALMSSPHG